MSDLRGVSPTAAFAYAASKLDAAAVLSASHLQDMYQPYNLGFLSGGSEGATTTVLLDCTNSNHRSPGEQLSSHRLPREARKNANRKSVRLFRLR